MVTEKLASSHEKRRERFWSGNSFVLDDSRNSDLV